LVFGFWFFCCPPPLPLFNATSFRAHASLFWRVCGESQALATAHAARYIRHTHAHSLLCVREMEIGVGPFFFRSLRCVRTCPEAEAGNRTKLIIIMRNPLVLGQPPGAFWWLLCFRLQSDWGVTRLLLSFFVRGEKKVKENPKEPCSPRSPFSTRRRASSSRSGRSRFLFIFREERRRTKPRRSREKQTQR
jgi:hypothetical protein